MNIAPRLAALTLAALAAGSAGAATPQDYAYAWPLATPGDSGAWQVELTPEMYAAASDPGLRDIVVVNAQDEAVPLAVARLDRSDVQREETLDAPLFELPRAPAGGADSLSLHIERDGGGHLRRLDADVAAATPTDAAVDYLLDASAARGAIDALTLDWDRGHDVQARFALEASDDLQTWRSLVPAASLIDLHRDDARLARHQIAFPATPAKYLRLRRLDDGARLADPVATLRQRIAGPSAAPALRWIEVPLQPEPTHEARPQGEHAEIGAYRYRLPAALPVESARIVLDSDNSIARLSLASATGQNAKGEALWQPRAELTAFQLRQDGVVLSNDEVRVEGGARAQDWRIQTWQPLDRAPRLSLAYRPDRLLFLARGSAPYRLLAGSARARRADYPVEAAVASLRGRFGSDWQPPVAVPAARRDAGGSAALAAPPPERAWKTWILWIVLAAGAALVAALALSLLKENRPSR